MMRHIRKTVWVVTLFVALCVVVAAQGPSRAELALRAAIETETVKGDVRKAIDQYKKLAEEKDHAIAVQALLRLASVYQKQGDAEARKVYERIVKDFADQKAALAAARAQLGVISGEVAGIQERLVPGVEDINMLAASVSADGRLVAYGRVDETGEWLVVRDLASGVIRELSEKAPSGVYIQSVQISPDSQQVAYQWCKSGVSAGCEVRLIGVKEQDVTRFRVLYKGRWADVKAWTPDNKAMVVYRTFDDGKGDLVLMSATDGTARVLKRDPGQYANFFVSPDGKFLALDRPAKAELPGAGNWDIFLLPLSGGPEVPVVEHWSQDRLAGWSPDGKYLAFTSDRTNRLGLYAQAVVNGVSEGSPRLLVDGLKAMDVNPYGVTAGGDLYFGENPSRGGYSELQTATINLQSGAIGKSIPVAEQGRSARSPAWSSDGKSLAYVADRKIVIRDMASGSSRELQPSLPQFAGLKWSPDGSALLVSGTGQDPREPSVFTIDARTGEAKRVANGGQQAVFSPDSRTLYYRRGNAQDVGFFSMDVATGNEREILRRPGLGGLNLSPDGRYIVTAITDSAANTRTMVIVPTGGGEPKVLKVIKPVSGGATLWSPDSRYVIVGDGKELWRITLDGQETKFGNQPVPGAQVQLSPDGKTIAFVKTITAEQGNSGGVWVVEHVFPQKGK